MCFFYLQKINCIVEYAFNRGEFMKTMEYYYDYTKEAYNYIMSSNILRNRDKKILRSLVEGKKVKEIAY